ncbi:MAG: hypothetical protein WB586_07850 [Chthoniobacterales bacterium]
MATPGAGSGIQERGAQVRLYPAILDEEAAEVAKKKEKPFPQAERTRKVRVKKGISGFQMNARLLSVLVFTLVAPAMAATTNGITFSVRQENGANQYYRLEVPPNVPPAKPDSPKISQNQAAIAAVGWAGGLETNGGLTTLGGSKPGGFYNATYIKVDSVQSQTDPIPYYLVQMNGNIGQTRQTIYAAVLEDGRIITPTIVSGPAAPQKMTKRGHGKR